MLTLEQIEQQRAEVDKLDVCCQKCRWFGRTVDYGRMPSGECHLRAPGVFTTRKIVELSLGGKILQRTEEEVKISFPPVWPYDHCGSFESVTDAPKSVV